jgi:hypothetical protein
MEMQTDISLFSILVILIVHTSIISCVASF